MKKVTIYTDGGCEGNPGPGGWAAVLMYQEYRKEVSGGEPATTNNRMEMRAALESLRALNQPCEVIFYTDSQYLRKGITEWIKGWKVRGWLTSAKEPVENRDLWQALDAEAAKHKMHWHWVKGHAGHQHNERCDELANTAIRKVKKEYGPEKLNMALKEFKARKNARSSPMRLGF